MTDMGIFRTRIAIAALAAPDERREIEAMVDTGSEYNWVPRSLLERLDVVVQRVERFETANGQVLERDIGFAMLYAAGRVTATVVVFAEDGDMTLLGAIGLEGLNLRVDLARRELVPAGPVPVAASLDHRRAAPPSTHPRRILSRDAGPRPRYLAKPIFIDTDGTVELVYSIATRAAENSTDAPRVARFVDTNASESVTTDDCSCARAPLLDSTTYGATDARSEGRANFRLATTSSPSTVKSMSSGPYMDTKLARIAADQPARPFSTFCCTCAP